MHTWKILTHAFLWHHGNLVNIKYFCTLNDRFSKPWTVVSHGMKSIWLHFGTWSMDFDYQMKKNFLEYCVMMLSTRQCTSISAVVPFCPVRFNFLNIRFYCILLLLFYKMNVKQKNKSADTSIRSTEPIKLIL